MTTSEISYIISATTNYNLHSHSEFCDGRAPMSSLIEAAIRKDFKIWGVTPHSPIPIESGCNMLKGDVPRYIERINVLKEIYADEISILCGMEVDYLGKDYGPHIDYFHKIPLEYRIGSVHFVPNQDGRLIDCDGSSDRFKKYLISGYKGDLRYVVEKYFEQVLTMLELGCFEILGHFDKIIGNAATVDDSLENQRWYRALIEDVINHAKNTGVIVEINTKSLETKGRFFPSELWWDRLLKADIPIAVNSDCHHPDLTNTGRNKALQILSEIKESGIS